MIPKNVQMPNPNPKYKPPGTPTGGREGNAMSKDYPCIYFEKDGMCRKFTDDTAISYCVMGPCPYNTSSNADRIRAMSDEALAKYLSIPCDCAVDPERDGYRECGSDLCVKHLLERLQQPAEEETP